MPGTFTWHLFLPALASLYLRFVGLTSRVVWLGRDIPKKLEREGKMFVYAFWHARQAMLAGPHAGEKASILVSRSKDGAIIAGVLDHLGLRTVRGSSSRGASASVLELLRLAELEGLRPAITPDGPRGPARRAKAGGLFLASRLNAPVLPLSAAARRKIVFKKAWDQFQFPLPFNKLVIAYADPIEVGDDPKAAAAALERSLDGALERADREAARPGAGLWLLAYNLIWPVLLFAWVIKVLLSPRRGALKGAPEELRERLGSYGDPPADRTVLWFHAASLGEVKSLAKVLPELRASVKDAWVLVTTSTATGRAEAARLPGVDAARLAPLDFAPIAQRAVRAIRPAALFLAETELWPNTLLAAAESGARLFVLNGRLSAKSAKGYRWLEPLIRESLAPFDRLCVQTEADADRYVALGAPKDRVVVTGNLKHDLLGAPHPAKLDALGWRGAPLFVAGSTHEGEEQAALEAFAQLRVSRPELRLVLVPRHVERSARVMAQAEAAGLSCALWSGLDRAAPGADCLVVDRIGHLLALYAASTFAFVGGSLVPKGGHNLLEPASLRRPVLFGPHTEAVTDFADRLIESGGGYRVAGGADIAARAGVWLSDDGALKQAGDRARKACEKFQGATRKTLDTVLPRLTSV